MSKILSQKTSRLKANKSLIDPKDKWGTLSALLEKAYPPSETILSFQVYGVYSIPEFWGKLQSSGSVDQWQYQVKLSDATIKEGKYNFKELTEEEKKELENKKKPPPKINKKDLEAVRLEEERLLKEQKQKEEKEKELQDKLNQMQPSERWYYLKEMPTQEPWVSWMEGHNIAQAQKNGQKFVELEEDINVNKGAILEMDFIPGPDDNEKKRPKPKGISPDEVKPVNCVTWIDFSNFKNCPGATEITLRSKLMLKSTYEKRIDDYEARTGKKILNPTNEEIVKMVMEGCPKKEKNDDKIEDNTSNNNNNDQEEMKVQKQKTNSSINKVPSKTAERPSSKNNNNTSKNNNNESSQQVDTNKSQEISDEQWNIENNVNLDYVEKSQTYIYIKIVLSNAMNPKLPDIALPNPIDLIKKEDKEKKAYTIEEMEKDLLRQFKIAIAAIAKTYDEAMGDSNKKQLIRREKGNILSPLKQNERDTNNSKFLEKFYISGRSNLLKEKLKKFIVKIVREKYNKKNTSVKGVYRDSRDQFYSELYAYLTDSVKKATDELVVTKKDELHEDILVSFSQSKKEVMNYCIRQNNEPENKRLLRLSKEYELMDDYENALKYYRNILALEQNKTSWLNYLMLAQKLDNDVEVETAITNAICIEPEIEDVDLEIIYCGMLFLKGQIVNAINFMQLIVIKTGLQNTNCIFSAFLAFLYKELSLLSPTINIKTRNSNITISKDNTDMINNGNTDINNNINIDKKEEKKEETKEEENLKNKNVVNQNKPEQNNQNELNASQAQTIHISSQSKRSPYESNYLKYFEAAKMFKMKSLPPEELKPAPIIYTEEELAQMEKEKKQKEKDNKNKISPEEEEKLKQEALKKGNPKLNPDFRPPVLNSKQLDSIWFDVINLFNKYNFYEISSKLLKYVSEESKENLEFRLIEAKILISRKEYDDAIDKCNFVLEKLNSSYLAYLLKGHAYYYKKDYKEAEKNYICAIRYKPQNLNFDLEMLTKLGLIYIKENSYYDAKVIFKEILRDSTYHSFAWKYLGFVLTKLGEYEEAEKALSQANVLDIENPVIWAYLTIFCLHTKRKYQALECLNELNKVKFMDINLFTEIAELFYNSEEFEVCANIYIKIKNSDLTNAEYYLKIADILYYKLENKKDYAIEILKDGLVNCIVEDDKLKLQNKINEFITKINNQMTMDKNDNNDDELNLTDSQLDKIKQEQFFDDKDENNKMICEDIKNINFNDMDHIEMTNENNFSKEIVDSLPNNLSKSKVKETS